MSAERTIAAMEALLLDWYEATARDLPWRRTRDPYAILVSEVMLQQTQVGACRPAVRAVAASGGRAIDALAAASPGEVIGEWQGLGYNRRALALHRAARRVSVERMADGPHRRCRVSGPTRPRRSATSPSARTCSRATSTSSASSGARGVHSPARAAQALMDLGATSLPGPDPALRRVPAGRSDAPRAVRATSHARKQSPFEGSFRQRRGGGPPPGHRSRECRPARPGGRRLARARWPRRRRRRPGAPSFVSRRQRPSAYPGRASAIARQAVVRGSAPSIAAYATKRARLRPDAGVAVDRTEANARVVRRPGISTEERRATADAEQLLPPALR